MIVPDKMFSDQPTDEITDQMTEMELMQAAQQMLAQDNSAAAQVYMEAQLLLANAIKYQGD